MRPVLLLLFAVPLAGQTPRLSPFDERKAVALIRQQLPCLGCHELGGDGGRSAPSLTDIGSRRDATYIKAIVDDPQRIVPGAAMPRVRMPAGTRDLVVAYLARNARAGTPLTGASTAAAVPPATVARRYQKWCASCHGTSGGGDGPNARYLAVPPAMHSSADQMSRRSDDALFDAIAGGGTVMGKSARMPPFGGTLTSAEIRALVAYIRALCACRGPAWSLDGSR